MKNYFARYSTVFLMLFLLVPAIRGHAAVVCVNENPAVAETTPTSGFVDNNDGTVFDPRTGLTWMICNLGRTWGSGVCGGPAEFYSWRQGLQAALDMNSGVVDHDHDGKPGFAGRTGWRLPNQAELVSIVEERCWNPAINGAIFPDVSASSWYWSSSPYLSFHDLAWSVDFGVGNDELRRKDDTGNVRLVRGGP